MVARGAGLDAGVFRVDAAGTVLARMAWPRHQAGPRPAVIRPPAPRRALRSNRTLSGDSEPPGAEISPASVPAPAAGYHGASRALTGLRRRVSLTGPAAQRTAV
jgi:hypothetical protein